jgi:hypothetical protein
MFGDFTKGCWVSIYRGRVPNSPLPSMRVMTGDMPGATFPQDELPRFRGRPARFLFQLLATWATMRFRSPRLAGIPD